MCVCMYRRVQQHVCAHIGEYTVASVRECVHIRRYGSMWLFIVVCMCGVNGGHS